MQNRRQDQLGRQYAGILNDMRDPSVSGPTADSGLLQADPNLAAMKLAQVPGYESLANHGISQYGAMQRQQQEQDWSTKNMTLAQKSQLDLAKTQQQWQQDRQVYEHDNPSAYQRDNMAQGWAGIGLQGQQLQRQYGLDKMEQDRLDLHSRYPALALTGQALIDFQRKGDIFTDADKTSTDVIDMLEKAPAGWMTANHPTVAALNQEVFLKLAPVMRQLLDTGTLNEGDKELFLKNIPDIESLRSVKKWDAKKYRTIRQVIRDVGAKHFAQAGQGYPTPGIGESSTMRANYGQGINQDAWVPYKGGK